MLKFPISKFPISKTSGCFAGPRNALLLDGSDDYVTLSTSFRDAFNSLTAFSFVGWVYATTLNNGNWGTIFSTHTDASAGRVCIHQLPDTYLSGYDDIYLSVYDGTTYGAGYTTSNVMSVNTWIHIAFVYEGSGTGNDGKIKCYINGKPEPLTFTETVPSVFKSAFDASMLGALIGGGSRFKGGMFDEFSFWNIALTQPQIADIMTRNLAGSETGLFAYYRFDQNDGTTLYDMTSNSNNGTLTGPTHLPTWTASDAFNTWIGGESGAWSTAGNWSFNDTPVSTQNVGGLGAVITTTANMGSTTISRGHGEKTKGSAKSILRYYDIAPTTNTGLSATLVFNYNDAEFNGITENKFTLFRTADGTNWTNEGGTLDAANNKITKTGISSFSTWTIGDNASPLPVELISFTAMSAGKNIELTWQTATEVNNAGFEIHRTPSPAISPSGGGSWTTVAFVEGHGTTNAPQSYSFTDKSGAGKFAYRLKQIDRDGKFEYSQTVEAMLDAPNDFAVEQNFPNPFNPSTTISFQIPAKNIVTIKVFDILGKEVATILNEEREAGSYKIAFNGASLGSGMYMYQIRSGGDVQTRKFTLMK